MIARERFNGQKGLLDSQDPSSGRWRVRLGAEPFDNVRALPDHIEPTTALAKTLPPLKRRGTGLAGDDIVTPPLPRVEPVSTATTPKSMSRAESRASRGEVIVPGALRQSLRKTVTKDFTQRDVHRMRNIGMSTFAEADANRQPGTRGDPCPKIRKPPPRRKLMMMATRDLEDAFQKTDNAKFKRGLMLKRLPTFIDPLTPPDEEDEDCRMCDADAEAKRRVEAAARRLDEEGCDHVECYGCMCEREKGRQKEERESMGQEEALQRRAREWQSQQDELKKQEEKRRLEAERWAQILKEKEDRERAEIAAREEAQRQERELWEEEQARRQREHEEERRLRRSCESWESDSNGSELSFPKCDFLNKSYNELQQKQDSEELQEQEGSEKSNGDFEFEEDKASCHACSMEKTAKKKASQGEPCKSG